MTANPISSKEIQQMEKASRHRNDEGQERDGRAEQTGQPQQIDGLDHGEDKQANLLSLALSASDPAHNNNPAASGWSGGVVGGSSVVSGGKVGPAPVSLSQILQRSGGGGGGGAPSVGVGVSQAPSERAASHPPALVPSHQHHSPYLYQPYKTHQPNSPSSITGAARIMGHGASCLTGSPAPASSSSTNNCSVSSFTPLQRACNQSTQHKVGAAPAHSTTTTAVSSTQPTTAMNSSSSSTPASGQPQVKSVPDDYQYLCSLVPELKAELKERESRLDLFQTETLELKRRLKKRDEEIGRLQREIHKLKVPYLHYPPIGICLEVDCGHCH